METLRENFEDIENEIELKESKITITEDKIGISNGKNIGKMDRPNRTHFCKWKTE